MLDSYRQVLTRPGALAFSGTALVARLPMSMVGLGIVLLVEERTGSYGLAGTVSAAFVLAEAAFAVLHGRLVDSFGQSRVLPVAISLFGASMALMVLSVERDWPLPLTFAFAAASGASLPQRGTEPPAGRRDPSGAREPMPWRLVLTLALVCLTLGALFGAAEVTTVAFADEQGMRWAAGWLLATWAVGSLVAGLVTGAVTWRSGPEARLRWGSAAMALAMVPLMFVISVPVTALVLLVGGLAIAPTMIGAMTMTEQGVPASRLTEGMAILHTGIVAGVAPGAGIAGFVVDQRGASAAYAVALAGGVLGALLARTARPSPSVRS